MNKTVAIIIGSVLAVALTTATIALNNKNQTLTKENTAQKNELIVAAEEIEIKEERIQELEIRISELEEKIETYEARIAELEATIVQQKKDIRYLKGKIKRRNKTIDDLTKEISQLARSRNDESERIAKLEAEKKALLKEITKYDAKYADLLDKQNNDAAELEQQRLEKMRQERIRNIVSGTKVVFENVEARERKDSRDMRKIKKNKWRYTNLQFYLQHANGPRDIMDEDFTVIIRDMDTGKVLPYIEGNPKFPGNKIETGFPVRYNGNMFIIDYYNNEVKKGKNFEVEVSYVLNGKKYELTDGKVQIIDNGKVLQVGKTKKKKK